MAERQGVEIEYCPVCRGVWLDRGELDKIIERSSAWVTAHEADLEMLHRDAVRSAPEKAKRGAYPDPASARRERQYRDDDDDDDSRDRTDSRRRRTKSFLGDLFDIFD